MRLSQKDLVKLGRYEASQGYSLNKIEDDFLKKGIKRKDAIRALEVVDSYNKKEQSKIPKEASQKQGDEKNISKNKSSFWLWFILLALIGAILYLYFSGIINFDWLHSIINFK